MHLRLDLNAGRAQNSRISRVGSMQATRALHLPLLLAAVAPPAGAWISTSQVRYGTQINDIQLEAYGESLQNSYKSLGWLWTSPDRTHNDAGDAGHDPSSGLGQSITWAWDPALCDLISPTFREDFMFFNFVDCKHIKASVHRAFAAWSANHPLISFTEVTSLCEQRGEMVEGTTGCSAAEVWVTSRNSSAPAAYGQVAAVATVKSRLTNSFRYTNGETPKLKVGNMLLPRQVIEVYGGKIEFAYEGGMCWYLDSGFCSVFHSLKKSSSPEAVYVTTGREPRARRAQLPAHSEAPTVPGAFGAHDAALRSLHFVRVRRR